MWLQLTVGLLSLSCFTITSGEILDVTTIYDLGSENDGYVPGRVHVRTNALGLPLSNGAGKSLISKNVQNFNLTCDVSEIKSCNWDYGQNYSVGTRVSQEIILKQEYKVTDKFSSVVFEIIGRKTLYYHDDYYDGYDDRNQREHVYLYIGKQHFVQDAEIADVIFIGFHDYNSQIYIYDRCNLQRPGFSTPSHRYQLEVKSQDESFFVFCENNPGSYNIDFKNELISFNFIGNVFSLYHGSTLFHTLDMSHHVDELYCEFYFETSLLNQFRLKPQFIRKVLSPTAKTTNGAEMVSPRMMLKDADELCLTLVVHSYKDSRQDVLHLLAEDSLYTVHPLVAVNDVKAGWNVKRLRVNIEKKIVRPFRLIIRDLSDVSIARISYCDIEGEEVWPIEPTVKYSLFKKDSDSKVRWTPTPTQVYEATLQVMGQGNNLIANGSILINYCQNGGVMIAEGCVCRPGFTGTKCETGCGQNRFGLDCRGKCSVKTNMCERLLMCNSVTGCHCAPGYKGQDCYTSCEPSEYGNDCEQTCGHCSWGSQCNIFTGKCQFCEPGYSPPYCKQETVYYASSPELSSLDYGTIKVTFNPKDTSGVGIPELYQIQYKEKDASDWEIFINKNIEKSEIDSETEVLLEETIEGLKAGYLYEVRVVLLDANFNKYDGALVQVSEIVTKCDIPDEYDYTMRAETSSSHIMVYWSYTNETENWCPVDIYELTWKEGWEWKTSNISDDYFSLQNLLPNSSITFRVRAKTSRGYAPSSELVVSTQPQGSSDVRDLRVVASHATSVQISWNPPKDDNRNLIYKITYKCVTQPACEPGCVNATEGILTQEETSVTLSPLLPFAQYNVTVTPEDGPETSIYVGTAKTEPSEVPKLSAQGALRTNTSLTVFWEPMPVCSSFLLGYNYHLYKESDNTKILHSGFTKTLTATFHQLVARTNYNVRVFVVTIAGWNPDAFLEISTSTSATVPEAVRNLTVYKRSRNSLGLRWAAPSASYGPLKAFTVSYSLGSEENSETVAPTPCVPWPHLYCHTIQGLWGNRKYNVSVSARNSEVAEDGAKISVIGITKESPPSAPEGLRLTNSSSTSVSVEWRYPDLANGIIRSFLISVEETEQFNQDDCCQVFPLDESPVQEELPVYKSEVSGLHPASTYFVSVSAKTVGLGPPQSLVVHTKPPHLPFSILPRLQSYNESSWLPQKPQPQLSNNSEIFHFLIKAHMLLLVEEDHTAGSANNSGIFNPQLNALLQNMISKPFYFYTEYSQEYQDVTLTSSPEMVDSTWGSCLLPFPLSFKNTYKLVAVQVSEYNSEFNVDLCYLIGTITFDA